MFLQYAAPGALLPLYSTRLKELGFAPMTIAACCATQALGYVLISLSAGQTADRWFPAERCLAVLGALEGVALWTLAGLTDPYAVFGVTLLYWMLTGPIFFLGTAVCFNHLRNPETEFGTIRLWGTVGWMAPGWLMVAWFGAVRADTADAFRLGGLLAFALAGYALTLPPTPPRRNPSARFAPLAALRQLRSRTCVVYLVCLFGVYLFWPFTTQGTPLLLKQLGVAHAWMMPTLTLAQAVEATTLGLLPLLLPRLGTRAVMLGALAAWTLGLFLSGVGRPVGVVVASLPCNGLIVSGFLVVGQMFANRQARPDLRSSMQALLAFVSGLAMLLGHLLLGAMRLWLDGDLPPAFAAGAAFTAVLLVVFAAGFHETGPLPAALATEQQT